MTEYIFTTPVVEEGPIGRHRLFYFYKMDKGVSIAKSGGTYSKLRYPLDEDIISYDEFYLGGHEHIVDAATKAALIASGLGITEANFTAV